MKTFLLKIDSTVYTGWQEEAKKSNLTMSEWIRLCCNRTVALETDRQARQEVEAAREHFIPIVEISREEARRQWPNQPKPCKHGLLFCKKCA